MCGIFGYLGKKDPVVVCLQGLQSLAYRGYDSSGIAGVRQGELLVCKEAGKLQKLQEKLIERPLHLELAIAHTRWATHGPPSQENAHPQFDSRQTLAVVHNGIIENHLSLRRMLESKGVPFHSDTDSEVIAQLISHLYEDDLLEATRKALSFLKGFWAIALIHRNHPGQIVATVRENPLVIGQSQARDETLLSSDPHAFGRHHLDAIYLRNGEVALLTDREVQLFDMHRTPVSKRVERLQIETTIPSKQGFAHFMLKEIFEQPHTMRRAMEGRIDAEQGMATFEPPFFSHEALRAFRKVLILGCGTSFHAGSIAAMWVEQWARIPAHAEIASEFRYREAPLEEDTLVIAVSQSGETFDTLCAAKEAKARGAKVLALCNVKGSTLTREAHASLLLHAGPEISVCSTKAFTNQLTVLALFSLLMGRLRSLSLPQGRECLLQLQRIPLQIQQILDQMGQIQACARKYAHFENFFFLGRHYMYPTCLEAALKLKEISYLNALGCPAGELKHGPIALVSPQLAVVGLCGNEKTHDKMLSNLMEVKSRGSPILAFAFEGNNQIESIASDTLWLPKCCDELAGLSFAVASQLLAYSIALERGREIDQPRNLAKSVTVE